MMSGAMELASMAVVSPPESARRLHRRSFVEALSTGQTYTLAGPRTREAPRYGSGVPVERAVDAAPTHSESAAHQAYPATSLLSSQASSGSQGLGGTRSPPSYLVASALSRSLRDGAQKPDGGVGTGDGAHTLNPPTTPQSLLLARGSPSPRPAGSLESRRSTSEVIAHSPLRRMESVAFDLFDPSSENPDTVREVFSSPPPPLVLPASPRQAARLLAVQAALAEDHTFV
jgi:hypothetical protein